MESIRTFIAVDVNVEDELKEKWLELKSLLHNDRIKWVDENTIHLTLFFLGETPINRIDEISKRLELSLKKTPSFKIILSGLGFFGNRLLPKVIWVGISESKPLFNLKEIINSTISGLGFDEPHGKFSPHITLGRVKQIKSSDELINYINTNMSTTFQIAEIDKVVFYQSILTPTGPTYKLLKEIKLLSL